MKFLLKSILLILQKMIMKLCKFKIIGGRKNNNFFLNKIIIKKNNDIIKLNNIYFSKNFQITRFSKN